jgi:hypothetical protein
MKDEKKPKKKNGKGSRNRSATRNFWDSDYWKNKGKDSKLPVDDLNR